MGSQNPIAAVYHGADHGSLYADDGPPFVTTTATVAWSSKKLNDRTITHQVGLVAGYTSHIGLDIANRTAVVILQNSFNWTKGEAVTNR